MRCAAAVIALLAVVACVKGRAPEKPGPDMAEGAALPPCPKEVRDSVRGIDTSLDWRLFVHHTFRYCVPASWRSGGFGWQGDGGGLIAVQSNPRQLEDDFQRSWVGPGLDRNYTRMKIGGYEADIWDMAARVRDTPHDFATYETWALWREPAVYFEGRTKTRRAVEIHRHVFQTMRFVTVPRQHRDQLPPR